MTEEDRNDLDRTDDGDDGFDDDLDYDGEASRARTSRDTWLLAGATLAIIAVVVLVIVFKGDDKKSGNAGGTDTAQTDSGGTAKLPPQWPDEATHPPKGLEGSGKPTPGASPIAPGVYFWYAFHWQMAVVPGAGVGLLDVTVKDTNAPADPAKQADVKLLAGSSLPAGVTATNESKGTLKLHIPPSTETTVVSIDVNGFVGSLTWTFSGIDTKLVRLGTSAGPITGSTFVVTKQQFSK